MEKMCFFFPLVTMSVIYLPYFYGSKLFVFPFRLSRSVTLALISFVPFASVIKSGTASNETDGAAQRAEEIVDAGKREANFVKSMKDAAE